VVLKADQKEFEKLKDLPNFHVLVKDNGLTEVVAGTETCICFLPMKKSLAPKPIKRLQTLK
jgi:peptidyl-tRNA hydrolase